MNLEKLFNMQKALDEKIVQEKGLEGQDLLPQKLLALQVEIAELANETRCFKYWSTKPPAPRERQLEELVDVLHFILSVGISIDVMVIKETWTPKENNLTDYFLELMEITSDLDTVPDEFKFSDLVETFIKLTNALGFTDEEVEAAYIKKNEINYQRLATGY